MPTADLVQRWLRAERDPELEPEQHLGLDALVKKLAEFAEEEELKLDGPIVAEDVECCLQSEYDRRALGAWRAQRTDHGELAPSQCSDPRAALLQGAWFASSARSRWLGATRMVQLSSGIFGDGRPGRWERRQLSRMTCARCASSSLEKSTKPAQVQRCKDAARAAAAPGKAGALPPGGQLVGSCRDSPCPRRRASSRVESA